MPKKKLLVYVCENCHTIEVLKPLEPDVIRALLGGHYHYISKLEEVGYKPPPLNERARSNTSPSFDSQLYGT